MEFEAPLLCRLQFGLTASYHVIFPSLIIGLTGYLLVHALLWQVRRKPAHRLQFEFWARILMPVFVLAVITGTVLSYQLDHVFPGFYAATREILTPIRRTELLVAMLLEAGCFAILVWGWRRVGDRLHLLATCVFACGVAVAAVCILGRNSWMHTPAGYALIDGEIRIVDWLEAILNPSFPYRFAHMVGAAVLSTGLVILAVSSWLLLKQRHVSFARRGLRNAVLIVGLLAPLQVFLGDLHGLNTRDHQPTKLAAMEALWQTQRGAPMVLFGWPDAASESNRWQVALPKLASLIVTHDLDGEVRGLDAAAPQDRPFVPLVFFAFRIMVGCGLALIGLGAAGLLLLRRGRLYDSRWFLRLGCCAFPLGFVATIAGWCVTEVGRQPWVVYGLVRTSEVIDAAAAPGCATSLPWIGAAYVGLFIAFTVAVFWIVRRGPLPDDGGERLIAPFFRSHLPAPNASAPGELRD